MGYVQHISVKPVNGIRPEQARDARARAWALVFQCWHKKLKPAEPTPEPDGRNDASIRNEKEVSDVNQPSNKPSEIVVINSRKLRTQ